MPNEIEVITEVLVVGGGGGAALFATIKAKEAGAQVTLVDKGHAGYSGQSPYADGFLSFKGSKEDLDVCTSFNRRRGEYLINMDYANLVYSKCEDRFNDMKEWGVEFFMEDGQPRRMGKDPSACYNLMGMKMPVVLRKKATSIGVDLIGGVMIVELLTKDGAVVGAVGLSTQGDFYEFHAKAVILCTGATTLKPNGWPSHNLTGDGDVMAYHVGASIMGKEFTDGHAAHGDTPCYLDSLNKFSAPKIIPSGPPKPGQLPPGAHNAEGDFIPNVGTLSLHTAYEVHKGKGPITASTPEGVSIEIGGFTAGMALHKAVGILPVGVQGDTEIPGLFAAGDAMATMQHGAMYCPGSALGGSTVTGAESGIRAAQYVTEIADVTVDQTQVDDMKALLYAPLNRKGGYSPRWVIEQLQNLMFPYYITHIKNGDRMEAVLTMLAFLRDHVAPKIKANDAHELRLAHEARNMILNSEMKMTASLARKESRGMHYREDYPFRDDENFLCWVTVKMGEDGKMVTDKVDIPKEWLPENFDTMTYEEKYCINLVHETAQ